MRPLFEIPAVQRHAPRQAATPYFLYLPRPARSAAFTNSFILPLGISPRNLPMGKQTVLTPCTQVYTMPGLKLHWPPRPLLHVRAMHLELSMRSGVNRLHGLGISSTSDGTGGGAAVGADPLLAASMRISPRSVECTLPARPASAPEERDTL